jgi:hypothetical protein
MADPQKFFEEVQAARVIDHLPAKGETLTVYHWIAGITYHYSKSLTWPFDLRAFQIAMIHTAAIALRAYQWADGKIDAARVAQDAARKAWQTEQAVQSENAPQANSAQSVAVSAREAKHDGPVVTPRPVEIKDGGMVQRAVTLPLFETPHDG